jgi:hypothetical protein
MIALTCPAAANAYTADADMAAPRPIRRPDRKPTRDGAIAAGN